MRSALLTAVAAASLTSVFAAPTTSELLDLVKRTELQHPVDGLPSCSGEGEDPSFAAGQSAFKDGEGVFIGDDCSSGHKKNSCWTDYYIVGTTAAYQPWSRLTGDINCTDTSTCSKALADAAMKCTTFTWSVTETVSAKFEFELKAFTLGLGAEISSTQGQSKQTCNTHTTTDTCSWDDDGCHSVWGSQLVTYVHGYKRRTCRSPAGAGVNMPDQPARDGGDFYTRGMMDFQIPIGGQTTVQCDGECRSDYMGPQDLPSSPDGGQMTPWAGKGVWG